MVFARFFFDSYLRCSRRAPILASTLAPRCVSSFLRASGMFLAPLHRCSTLVNPPLVDDLVDSFDSMCLHLSLSPSARVTSPAVPARLPPRQKLLPRPVPTPPTPTLATRPSPSLPPPATALALLQPAQTALAADLASAPAGAIFIGSADQRIPATIPRSKMSNPLLVAAWDNPTCPSSPSHATIS